MGQRLTVDILEDGEQIAIIYYHWSAYFIDTIVELKRLKDCIAKAKSENKDILLAIIEGLEKHGGGLGIDPRTRDLAKQKWPNREFTESIHRNEGLLFIDEEDIKEVYSDSEGEADIDIVTETIHDYVTLEYRFDRQGIELPVDPFKEMTFEDLDKLYDCLKSNLKDYMGEGALIFNV